MRRIVKGTRSGFTMIELLIGLVVGGIIMMGLAGYFVVQSQLVGEQESQRTSREAVRSAMQVFMADLRRVEASAGVEAASAESITIRVPFAMGLSCASNTTRTTISILPVDSTMYANAQLSGYGWRSSDRWEEGRYRYQTSITNWQAGALGTCGTAEITTLPRGHRILVEPGLGSIIAGTPVLLYERVRYDFASGTGGSLLLRTNLGDASPRPDTLVTFFDEAGTRFRFYVDGSSAPQDDPPGDLGQIRGLELVLEGRGERPRPGTAEVATTPVTPAVFFKNRPE